MNINAWSQVDKYFENTFLNHDKILEDILIRCKSFGLPEHNVSPCQGQFLALISKISNSKRILEIGTLGGYSTIWLARSVSNNGVVVTIESNELHAKIARENISIAGLTNIINVINGNAHSALNELINNKTDPFDLIFIDADKPSNPEYLRLSLKLSHSGTIIIGDNVVRDGAVANDKSNDPKVIGVRQYCSDLKHFGLESTGIQTVGIKGYDGFSISIVP